MPRTVYIETTLPGAYYEERDDIVSQFQRYQTRLWWRTYRSRYELYTSDAVLAELQQTAFPQQQEAIRLLDGIPVLPVNDEIRGVVQVYLDQQLMPRGHMGDAFHLAIACVHQLDYLLTWNCRHLANPAKVTHILTINRRLGLLTPSILTPQMLVEEVADESE